MQDRQTKAVESQLTLMDSHRLTLEQETKRARRWALAFGLVTARIRTSVRRVVFHFGRVELLELQVVLCVPLLLSRVRIAVTPIDDPLE